LIEGNWVTPDLASGCLPGVTRGFLIENFGVREARVTGDDLKRASAAAAVSSLREVQEIKAIDGKDFAISKELRELQVSFSSWVLGNLLS
jgi:branched-chain amino acid aminotransferase